MTHEPRTHHDYGERQVEAARRVLIDLGQVLASFTDAIVMVGGWVADLLIPDAGAAASSDITIDWDDQALLKAWHDENVG